MNTVFIDLHITADEYLKDYYAPGAIVTAFARDGRRVQFPANILRPYVQHAGIKGSFCIHFDEAGKFKAIKRL